MNAPRGMIAHWARTIGPSAAAGHAWRAAGGGLLVSLCGMYRAPGQVAQPHGLAPRCSRCSRANEAALAPLRVKARARWGRCTPYRLGLVVGYHGIAAASPYALPASAAQFAAGVAQGIELGPAP